jgi:hypothetical protein
MRTKIEQDSASMGTSSTHRIQKIINGFEKTLAHCALLSAEKQWLLEQNNEKQSRLSTRPTIVGGPKVMTYNDIVERRRLRETVDVQNADMTLKRRARRRQTAPSDAVEQPEFG